MEEAVVLRAEGLTKSYGSKKALRDVSLLLGKGRIYVLLGPNGSGKTTLIKVLAGLTSPDSGSVSLFNETLSAGDEGFRRRIGFLFDHSSHFEPLTGEENAWFFARGQGLGPSEASERLAHLFSTFNLETESRDPVSSYSYGMRRKLALIESMAHRPALLLLDEPSMGLDLGSRTRLYALLREEAARGATVVVSTNDMNEARYLADEVFLMDQGRMLISGPPAELVRRLEGRVTIEVEITVPIPLEEVLALPHLQSADLIEKEGRHVLRAMARSEVEEQALSELVQRLVSLGPGILRIDVRRPELDDVFLSVMKGGEAHAT